MSLYAAQGILSKKLGNEIVASPQAMMTDLPKVQNKKTAGKGLSKLLGLAPSSSEKNQYDQPGLDFEGSHLLYQKSLFQVFQSSQLLGITRLLDTIAEYSRADIDSHRQRSVVHQEPGPVRADYAACCRFFRRRFL